MRKLSQFCLFYLLTVTAVFAQVDTGTIAGTIRDSQGAGVASATITFVEVNTNATTKTQADGSGDYASPPLRPGEYKIVAEAQGFKTETRSTITLKVQDRLRMDFAMAVGSVSENIEVTGETPIVQTETSSLGQVITTTQITELPLNGRDYIQLATLSTGRGSHQLRDQWQLRRQQHRRPEQFCRQRHSRHAEQFPARRN